MKTDRNQHEPVKDGTDPPDSTRDDTITVPTTWPDPISGPWTIGVRFGAVAGRVECIGIEIDPSDDGDPQVLTRVTLRDVPLGKLVDDARTDKAGALAKLVGKKLPARLGDLAESGLGPLAVSRPASPGRPPLPPERFVEVAAIYLGAPRKPTTAVAEHFNVAQSTAAKWVRRARDLGLIAETTPGKMSGKPADGQA